MKWLAVAVLTLILVVPAVSEEIAQEPQQAEPNAPTRKVKKYRVQKDASGELMKDAEGNFIFVPFYVDEPNYVPPVAPPTAMPTTRPPARAAALGARLQRVAWDIGPEVYYFKYEEPGLMEEEGVFYGARLGYTYRDWVPASSRKSPSNGGGMFRAEGRFAFGQVDYDGETWGGSPLTFDNQDDFVFEGRLLLGADMLRGDTLNTLYAGVGYRYLYDDLGSGGLGGYERESNYLYIPLGYQFDSSHKVGWSFGATAEFDLFLWGQQNTHLSDVGFVDIENEQDSGYGLRGSVRFQKHGEKTDFIIEPFIRYWNIDKSDVVLGVYEPANETLEYGIQLIWRF